MKDFKILSSCFDATAIKQEAIRLEQQDPDETYIFEDDGSLRSIFAPHWKSKIIEKFIYNNSIIDYVKKQIGNDIYVHQCHFNYKKAHTGGDFAWHSDYFYWHNLDGMLKPDALSVLFVLDDFQDNNGPLQVVPDSYTWPVETVETDSWTIKHSSNEKLGIMASKTAYNALQLLPSKNDCIVMHANTMHASEANKSSNDRTVLFVCYNSLENKITKTLRPNYITLCDFKPV